jgi:hypothetical protein
MDIALKHIIFIKQHTVGLLYAYVAVYVMKDYHGSLAMDGINSLLLFSLWSRGLPSLSRREY